jgi:hypothetical protein
LFTVKFRACYCRRKTDGEELDQQTKEYIHRKMSHEEQHQSDLQDLLKTARQRVAASRKYLEDTHTAVHRSVDRLQVFTQVI